MLLSDEDGSQEALHEACAEGDEEACEELEYLSEDDRDALGERCDEYSQMVYEECIDEGGSENECGSAAEEAYGECM